MKKNWFEMKADAQQTAEISIYDDIGAYGVTAKDFIATLSSIAAPVIRVSINSPGGAVFDALAMFNALRQHPANIEVSIMGVAASAASLVAMAGDKITMSDNAFVMIHNPLCYANGNADELRDLADTLDKIAASLVSIYSNRTGQTPEKIKELLAAETWLTGVEALALGFADEVSESIPVTARFDLDRIPEAVRGVWAKLTPLAAPAPSPVAVATQLIPSPDFKAVKDFLTAYAERKGIALAKEIPLIEDYHAEAFAVCAAGGVPELAEVAIQANIPLITLRHAVMNFRVSQDRAMPISNHLPMPGDGTLASSIWNNRRGQA